MDRTAIGFESLRKGQVIAPERIEKAYGVQRANHQAYQFATLNLCGAIESETGMLARVDGETVRVMTDDEAEDHTFRGIINSTKRIARNERRRRENIDTTQLTDVAKYETRQRVASALAQSQRRELQKQAAIERVLAASASKGAARAVTDEDLDADDDGKPERVQDAAAE